MNQNTTTNTKAQVSKPASAEQRAWKKLRPGFNRIWLTADDIRRIERLRAAGHLPGLPQHQLAAILGVTLYQMLCDCAPIQPSNDLTIQPAEAA